MAMTMQQLRLGGFVTETAVSDVLARKGARRRDREPAPSLEEVFAAQLRESGITGYARDCLFANKSPLFVSDKGKPRLWRFDFAWHAYRVAVEIEGLSVQVLANPNRPKGRQFVVNGRHGTVDGIQEDMVKYNAAVELGWSVLRYSPKMVKGGEALVQVRRVLQARGWRRDVGP